MKRRISNDKAKYTTRASIGVPTSLDDLIPIEKKKKTDFLIDARGYFYWPKEKGHPKRQPN